MGWNRGLQEATMIQTHTLRPAHTSRRFWKGGETSVLGSHCRLRPGFVLLWFPLLVMVAKIWQVGWLELLPASSVHVIRQYLYGSRFPHGERERMRQNPYF